MVLKKTTIEITGIQAKRRQTRQVREQKENCKEKEKVGWKSGDITDS